MREDLSSGFTTMQDSNQPAQLQRVHVAGKLKFCVVNYTFRLRGCVGWSARLNLRMQLRQVFSRHGP